MEAQQSPDGSPGAAQSVGGTESQGALSGEMLALRMIHAAEAAATAAQAATQAVQAMSTGGTESHADSGVKPDWYKVLPKTSGV